MPPKKASTPSARDEAFEKARKMWLDREERDRDRYYEQLQLEPEEESLEQKIRRQKKELEDNSMIIKK